MKNESPSAIPPLTEEVGAVPTEAPADNWLGKEKDMRSIKILDLYAIATIAAMAAMAFLGTSSASAAEHEQIVLCKNAELVCEASNQYPSPTTLHLKTLPGDPPKLLSSIGTVECEYGLILMTLLNKLAKLIEAHLLGLVKSGNCHLGGTACTVTVNQLGAVSITPDAQKLTAVVKKIVLEGRTTNATYKCGSFINCTYSASAETELTAHSDAQGHFLLLLNESKLEGKGFLCPKTAALDAVYHAVDLDPESTLLTNLYIEL